MTHTETILPTAAGARPALEPTDNDLMAAVARGDANAFGMLIKRHDRLVRYVAFRIGRRQARLDPQWIDSVASDTWLGFAKQLNRVGHEAIGSATALLTSLARNRAVSALRHDLAGANQTATIGLEPANQETTNSHGTIAGDDTDNPAELVAKVDLLEKLRGCLLDLDKRDGELASQLDAITARRWKEAAAALGLSESTLRSRWKRVEGLLRVCLQQKTGKMFAPGSDFGDS